MVVDYFIKWVEVEALANIRDVDVKKFMWKNIVIRFRVLKSLMSDNEVHFESKAFYKYYNDLDIKNRYSTCISLKQWSSRSDEQINC